MTEQSPSSFHKNRYGAWAGNPKGTPCDPSRCAEEVAPPPGHIYSQCSRKRGRGPEGAYCKQHDPKAASARRRAASIKYELDSWHKYGRLGALAAIGRQLLDHLDQKCSFEDVEKAAQDYRDKQAKMDALKESAQ